jgi:hypothetical protein
VSVIFDPFIPYETMRCKYEGDLQGTPCFISLTTCKRRFMFVIGRMLAPLGNNRKQEYSNLEASRAVKLSEISRPRAGLEIACQTSLRK